MLIPLVCTQCGGKLEVENFQVLQSGDSFIVLDNQTFKCPHCDTRYLPGEEIRQRPDKTVITMSGDFNGSTIHIGSTLVTDKGSGLTSSKESQEIRNPPKKWWHFWKT
jgi:hypothetical protein